MPNGQTTNSRTRMQFNILNMSIKWQGRRAKGVGMLGAVTRQSLTGYAGDAAAATVYNKL